MALHKRVLLERFAQETKDSELLVYEAQIDDVLRMDWRPAQPVSVCIGGEPETPIRPDQVAHLRRTYEGKEWLVDIRYVGHGVVLTFS